MCNSFDTSPISPSGIYLAVFQLPFEDRQPRPGEKGNVIVVDLQKGTNRVVADTCGWEPQMGPNINWGGSDNELYFNDVGLRWFKAAEEPTWNMFKINHDAVYFAWVTVALDGGTMHCAVGPEQWEKGGHHGTWFPDGRRISMNLNIDRDVMRFVKVQADGTGLQKMLDHVTGSGHPTVHPDGNHLLTDTYTFEGTAFGDGTIPLRWVDLHTGDEKVLVRINTRQPCKDSVLRVDPHPAWDRSWRYVTFNGFVGGTRRVFVADLRGALE